MTGGRGRKGAEVSVVEAKQAVRERIWALLEREQVVRVGAPRGIPSFAGADTAAERLAGLPEWEAAAVLKTVPDRAQEPVRRRALAAGKSVYLAVPRLAEPEPFRLLAPTEEDGWAGRPVGIPEMRPVDMVVCGSVAVDRRGARLGKGAGYADIEMALLREAGLLGEDTVIVTTVHELQVLDEEVPIAGHDFGVDVIVTPERTIRCPRRRRPDGVRRESLTAEQLATIPALSARYEDGR